MPDIDLTCHVYGREFSPDATESKLGIEFTTKSSPGDIAPSGRYRGRPRPYGVGTLHVVWKQGYRELESAVTLEELLDLVPLLKEQNATDIWLQLNVEYDGQCNFEIDAPTIQRIADLKISLGVSCYTLEDEKAGP